MSLGKTTCPYPGLRPFNEEESIFFKGRDEHVKQIIALLEENKFLIITGASGDGKSSLVYAGVVPSARAGFFKAKHNSWTVASFRPERSPLKNLASALCKALDNNNTEQVEKELCYGFSALVELYKSSPYFSSEKDEPQLDETGRQRKNKAANLLIIIDQFEEFFTNVENYPDARPSFAAQAVVNLMLETARIALAHNLPIYVIFTMRSDYIGQCASFRGLPEFIGFSQFFVPRLNRKEIYQVIEEPAFLNGNRITRRLTETLISKLDEGFDQLPVLQHALNRIWHFANDGSDEMDLLHFAMSGGLHKKFLNANQRDIFIHWLNEQPEYKKSLYTYPSLGNVLDTHANDLHHAAAVVAIEKYNQPITNTDAALVLEIAFKGLTKIDEGRAVRNRMTLEEITNIIDLPAISFAAVGAVLNVFREQGNTFLKPFIEDDDHSQLSPGAILDITHESLIRNWALLSGWVKEEREQWDNFQDFNIQLRRWLDSDKSQGYLLPIGPLTFFEDWFKKVKPNKYWLVKYDDRNIPYDKKLSNADDTLTNSAEFIKKSARKLIVNRTIIRYGANKIIAALGLLMLVISCAYFTFDFRKKLNKAVLSEIETEGKDLLQSKYINSRVKADFILAEERIHPGSYRHLLGNFKDDSLRLDVLRMMLVTTLKCYPISSAGNIYNPLLDSLFIYEIDYINGKHLVTSKNLINNTNLVLSVAYEAELIKSKETFLYRTNEINEKYRFFCDNVYTCFLDLLKDDKALSGVDIVRFNRLIQTMPLIARYDKQKIKVITDLISPFNAASVKKFNLLYPKDKSFAVSKREGKITHNGGYFYMAHLFAFTGDMTALNSSFDSLLLHNNAEITHNKSYSLNFLYNLVISRALYAAEAKPFIHKVAANFSDVKFPLTIHLMGLIMANKRYDYLLDVLDEGNGAAASNVNFVTKAHLSELIDFNKTWAKQNKAISTDERNYLLALLYKADGFLRYGNLAFNIAFSFFKDISPQYLAQELTIGREYDSRTLSRSDIFLYPGNVLFTEGSVAYSLDWPQQPGLFISYLADSNLISKTYGRKGPLLNEYLLNYSHYLLQQVDDRLQHVNVIPFVDALNMDDSCKIDKNAVNAFLSLYYFKTGNINKGREYEGKIVLSDLFSADKMADAKFGKNYANIASQLCAQYALQLKTNDKSVAGKKLLNVIKNLHGYSKRNALLDAIDSLQCKNMNASAITLTDTLVQNVSGCLLFGNKLLYILGKFNSDVCDNLAKRLMKNRKGMKTSTAINLLVEGVASSGDYYNARNHIPEYNSAKDQLILLTIILKQEARNTTYYDARCWTKFDNSTLNDEKNLPYEESEYFGDDNVIMIF